MKSSNLLSFFSRAVRATTGTCRVSHLAHAFRATTRKLRVPHPSRVVRAKGEIAFRFIPIFLLFTSQLFAATAHISGRVTDPLGAAIPNAQLDLIQNTKSVSHTTTSQSGEFSFDSPTPGRYTVRATAPGFAAKDSGVIIVHNSGNSTADLTLSIGSITEDVVVSATGTALPESQLGASVSLLDSETIQRHLNLFDSIRLTPGVQGVQSGGQGGKASIFIRGGNSTSTKVLIDGVPANDIGGSFEYADLSSAAFDSAEIFRGPNSVLYGSDALSGVINATSRRGVTVVPELDLSSEGGTFGTMQNEGTLSGAYHAFDYLTDVSRLDTRNNVANSQYHNATIAGNFGWAIGPSTDLRFNIRHNASNAGSPNAVDLYGISDDSFLKQQNTFLALALQNQTTSRWHNLVRYSAARLTLQNVNPSPTGAPFDPFGFGPNFLGNPVTLCAPAGCAPAGQAILDFGGTYPSLFDSMTNRDVLQAQSDFLLDRHLTALFGFRFENERGITNSAFSNDHTSRRNYSYTLQEQSNLWTRFYSTIGVGLEKNAVFGFAVTPKVSLAYYLFRPTNDGIFSGTKLKFNFGKGIKEPSIFDQASSLFTILQQTSPQLVSQFHVTPAGPERSTSVDFGFDQAFAGRRATLGVTFFHNRFYDQLEFVDKTLLPQLGVPVAVASAVAFGAAVNSADYRARGLEARLELDLGHGFNAVGAYTFTPAVVTKSFSSDNLAPAINPAFPTTPIGAFSPLVGSRPFRIAPHVGTLALLYSRARFNASLDGYLASSHDDSTFLTDGFFGNSLLLPNRNLDGAYQKFDLSAVYSVRPGVTLFGRVENLFNERYDAAYGFPSLPLTVRGGIKLTIGGEHGFWR